MENCIKKFCREIKALTKSMKIVGFLEKHHLTDEINMILGIVRWEIWKSRCKNKYDDGPEKHRNLIRNIVLNIRNHIDVLLQGKTISKRYNLETLLRIFD